MSDWPASIGVIGCGAMGVAMARGLSRAGGAAGFVFVDAIPAAADRAAAELGGSVGTVDEGAACDLVVLAVKPKDAESALRQLATGLRPGAVVLSVMAGWDIDRIAALVPGAAIVRSMPNLAVEHGTGLVAVATRGLDAEAAARLLGALRQLGTVVELPEQLIGPATALVGSGPGFVALVAEGLEAGAVGVGFDREQARAMVQAVLAGTASLLADGTDPADLRQRVSSPGGTTVEGVAVLERGGVRDHVADAVHAAARRAAEL